MNLKIVAVLLCIAGIIGGLAGYKLGYREPVIQEKIVVKDVVRTVKEKTSPDGTKEVEIKEETREENRDLSILPQKKWGITLEKEFTENDFRAGVEYRILGDISIRASINNKGEPGLGLRYEF